MTRGWPTVPAVPVQWSIRVHKVKEYSRGCTPEPAALVQGHPLPRRVRGTVKGTRISGLSSPTTVRQPRLLWAAQVEAQGLRAVGVARLGVESPAASVSIDRVHGPEPRGAGTGGLRLRLRHLRGRKMPMTMRRRKRRKRKRSHTIPTHQIPGAAEGYPR